jgi:hypothetical protein
MMKKPLKPKPGPTSASNKLKPFVIMTYPRSAMTMEVQSKIADQFTSLGYDVVDVPLSKQYDGQRLEFKFMPENYNSNLNGHGNGLKSPKLKSPIKRRGLTK